MKHLPPGWPDTIPGLPLLFILVGAPLCHHFAQRERHLGFSNHIVLKDAGQAAKYDWPTAGLMVIVLLFCRYDRATEEQMIALLLLDCPVDVTVRLWPDPIIIRYVP